MIISAGRDYHFNNVHARVIAVDRQMVHWKELREGKLFSYGPPYKAPLWFFEKYSAPLPRVPKLGARA